jgi:plasmid stability protein
MELVRPLNEVLKDHAPPSGHHGYKVNHLPGEAVFLMEPDSAKDRAGVYRRRLEVPVRFTRVGKGSLPSANVAGDVWMAAPTKSKRSAGNWQPFVATSEPLDYEVRDLPASRPRDFRGNVGELHVTTSASQTKMPAGTPFTLTIRLEGQGYLPQQGSIDLTANPEFNHRFRMLIDNDRAASDTSREVTYTLRPLQAGIKEVPAVSVSYFDSRSDQFKTATSSPIPLEVTSGPAGAVADSSSQPVEAPEPDAAAAVPEQLPPLEDLAAAHKRAFFTRNLLPAGILILTVAVVLGVLVAGRFRPTLRWVRSEYASGTAARLRSRAAGHVRRRLTSKVQSAQEVRELLHQALRSHYDLPAGEVTSADVADRLRQAGVDDELVNACTDLLKACATAEFAPDFNSVSLSELAERARRLTQQLATVHRAVRSG